MNDTLENMENDTEGQKLLAQLKLDGFGHYPDSLFNEIRAMANKVQRTGPKYSLQPAD